MLSYNNKIKKIQDFHNIFFTKKGINMKDTILIAGSPRSGTTWLMEIFTTLPRYIYVFEPLNPIWRPDSSEVGFRSRTYLPLNSEWPEGEEYIRKIFTGQIANLPIKDSLIESILTGLSIKIIIHFMFGNKIIVKSINMNRMLPWIAKRFDLRCIFFIIRHPCAVIASQLKTGFCGYFPSSPPYFDVYPTKEIILDEASKINQLDYNLINKLKKLDKIEEILAAAWCLDNYIPLSQPQPYPWKLVFYEKLVKEGEKEIKLLFESIGEKDIPKSAFRRLRKPSKVTIKEDQRFIKKPDQQLSKWKEYLSEKQINKILEIVSYFNLDLYNGQGIPNY
jgi:hypothetical protein